MRDRIWAALIVLLMLLFWGFALLTPVISDKPRSHFTVLTCERAGVSAICISGR